ncbi:hypothetical protein [Nonomuraea wenchangensis]|uniref:hypothetical protein n=1 Tax=Nonomuraea wenchangensis TaxID=568860 RepID=UPI00332B7BF9
MNPTATAKALLADRPDLSLRELTDFAADMSPRDEDRFWAGVRQVNPFLCSEWH